MPAKSSKGCCCPPCRGNTCCCRCFADTICVHVLATGSGCACDDKAEAAWDGAEFHTFVRCGFDFIIGVKVAFSKDPYDGMCRVGLETECDLLKTVYYRRFGEGEEFTDCEDALFTPWGIPPYEEIDIWACDPDCSTAIIMLTPIYRVRAISCDFCGCLPECLCATLIDGNASPACVAQDKACWYDDAYVGGFDCPSVPFYRIYFEPTIFPLVPGSCDLILSIPSCGITKRLAYGNYACGGGGLTADFTGLDLTPCGGGNPASISIRPSTCNECGFGTCCGGILPETLTIEVTTEDGSSSGTLTFNPALGTTGGCWEGSLTLHCAADSLLVVDKTLNAMLCCTGPAESDFILTLDCGGAQSTQNVSAESCDPLLIETSRALPVECVPCLQALSIVIAE